MSLTLLIKCSAVLKDLQYTTEAAIAPIQPLLRKGRSFCSQKLPLPEDTENTYQGRAKENTLREPGKDGEWRDIIEDCVKFDGLNCAIQAKAVISLECRCRVPRSSYHLRAFSSASLFKDID